MTATRLLPAEQSVTCATNRTKRRKRAGGPGAPGLASHARRSVFIPIRGIFIALGLLLVALPKISADVLAALCAWIALGPAREAFRRRADR